MLVDWLGWEMEMDDFVGGETMHLLMESLRDNTIDPGWFS